MEQMETAPRLAGRSFGVGDVPLWGKLKALCTACSSSSSRHCQVPGSFFLRLFHAFDDLHRAFLADADPH